MICPTCHAIVDVREGSCPACQRQTAAIVESTLASVASTRAGFSAAPTRRAIPPERAPIPAPSMTSSIAPAHQPQRMPARLPVRPAHPVLGAAARLPALLWRQPAVRAAVRTSASAVALSLAARMVGRAVASRSARALAEESAWPALADLLTPHPPARRPSRRGFSRTAADVTETFIYIRRDTHH